MLFFKSTPTASGIKRKLSQLLGDTTDPQVWCNNSSQGKQLHANRIWYFIPQANRYSKSICPTGSEMVEVLITHLPLPALEQFIFSVFLKIKTYLYFAKRFEILHLFSLPACPPNIVPFSTCEPEDDTMLC